MPEKTVKTFKQFQSETKLYESMLTESDRIAYLKGLYKDKIDTSHDPSARRKTSDQVIDHLAQHADPAPNKPHTQWLVNQYRKGHIRLEDSPRLHGMLELFSGNKHKMEKKDINAYKHVADLQGAVQPFRPETKAKEATKIVTEGSELIHDGKTITVHKPLNKRAAQELGKETDWCTAYGHPDPKVRNHSLTQNAFEHYTQDGPLYMVTHKTETHKGHDWLPDGTPKRYLFHFESNQLADETDHMYHPKELVKAMPELREVKEFQNKSLHFNTKEGIIEKLKTLHKQPVSIKHEVATSNSIEDLLG